MPEEAQPYAKIMATGRSDYPNQINNVLCFPGLFRGALHCYARRITEGMNISAANAIASLVPEKALREELKWDTPRQTKVPYFRFDCHFSSLIDRSFKKVTGITEHGLLCNWFAQAGFVTKDEIADDFTYMNDDNRVDNENQVVFKKLNLPQNNADKNSLFQGRDITVSPILK